MNEEHMRRLLNEFSKISLIPKRKETFMTISGYPHYENVVSNILKFFFEDNEHGMKNLWARSLLESVPCFGNKDFHNIVVEEVFREYTTSKQKRIDIVVICGDYIISIENKIYACLTNDLQEYAKTIEKLNKNGFGGSKEVVNIVLSLNAVSLNYKTKNIPNLCNITYDMFFKKIKENIGAYILEADNDWLIKMQDFIYTVEGLKGGSFMNKEFAEFLYENKKDIDKLLDAIDAYRKNIKDEVKGLKNALMENESYKNYKDKNFKDCDFREFDFNCNWSEQRLFASVCIDIKTSGKILTIENFIDSKGWHIVLWARLGSKVALREVLKENNIDILENPYAIESWGGCEVACVTVKKDGYQEVIDKLIEKGLNAARIVLNNSNWVTLSED